LYADAMKAKLTELETKLMHALQWALHQTNIETQVLRIAQDSAKRAKERKK
jgi:hypothetical protein